MQVLDTLFATVTATETARATETATAKLYFSSEEVDEQLLA